MTRQPVGPAPAAATGVSGTTRTRRPARPAPSSSPEELRSVVTRLRRAHGQLGGIVRMIEDGRDCEDIVTQLSAVSKAVDRAGFAVIALGLRQCITDPTSRQVGADAMEKLFLSLA